MPLALEQWDSSAIVFRTHLAQRETATDLAIKLIRRAVQIEREEVAGDLLREEFVRIGEPWAIDHILQGCFIEEYHEWEKGIKNYIGGQRALNVVGSDFDWRTGNKNMVQRAADALSFFNVSIEPCIFLEIDKIRETVNAMKHDPLSIRVDEGAYTSAIKILERFWDQLVAIEGKSSSFS